jgi:hypothetical protein
MNQKKYLIYEYTNTDLDGPEITEVTEKEMFKMIQELRFEKRVKFAVYEIGQCVLDWS